MSDSVAKKQLVVAAIGILAIVLAVRTFLLHRAANPERKAVAMHKHGGEMMAELAAKSFGGRKSVLLILPDEGKLDELRARWMGEMAGACESGISGITVEGRETLATMISRVSMASNRPTTFTLTVYRDFLKRHPGANAVVSFVGEPVPAAGEAVSSGEKFPPMICFSPTGGRVAEMMAQGVVAAAIVPRSGPTPPDKSGGDWFDILYETVTPETVAVWAKAVRHENR